MKKVLISYGNKPYYGSLNLLGKSAIEVGKVDQFQRFTREWLEGTEFYSKNRYILDQPRGNGYWIWKPFIILEMMKELEEGDIVLYSDAAVEVISDLTDIFNLASEKKRILFQIGGGHLNKTFTKRDTFVLMGLDEKKYWDSVMITASYHLWEKNEENISFLKQYQLYLRDPRIVTDDPNMCGIPNILGFRDHRHDQSVLSLMAVRDNIERFRDPCQYGNEEQSLYSNSNYNQLFNHHRKKL